MRIAPSETRPGRRSFHSEPIILFSISGQTFAINANAIQEIRTTDSISAAATDVSAPGIPKVRHGLRRGRTMFHVVNGAAHFGLPASRPAQVVVLRNYRIAVLVDSIDRMETMTLLMALPPGFCGPERVWYRGVTLISENVVPVVSPAGFLTEQDLAQLDAAASEAAESEPTAEAGGKAIQASTEQRE
ncbi:MAG TPA: chemotaxis protein CheW [Candidatus Acidoferrales bacterium]|nr:chemotaxis protein CheW [Candidatus Acidoferrales bacterium]